MYRILIIEDDFARRRAAEQALLAAGHEVIGTTGAEAMWVMEKGDFDVVLAAETSPPAEARPEARPLPTLVSVPRPLDSKGAAAAIADLEERETVRVELQRAGEALGADPIVGRSPAMQHVRAMLAAVRGSDAPVLLTGESGTGKDLLAQTVHAESARRAKPFVAVNCAAFPETLLEAELFGHERGAFTGALQRREGRFKAADGGTLFLDEVNSLSLAAQAKLLRVLHDGTFQPIGTNATLTIDVRLISATNRDLRALVQEGKFREDLYYRIKVLDIHVPPLRERRGDVPLLVRHFLRKCSTGGAGARGRGTDGKTIPAVGPRAWAALLHHPYPGNVRELEHAVHRALVLARGDDIDVEHLPRDMNPEARPASTPPGGTTPAGGPDGASVRPLEEAVADFEREYLLRALRAAGGNKTKAAKLLGISRKNLWHKLTRLQAAIDDEADAGTGLDGAAASDGNGRPRSIHEQRESGASDPPRRGRRRPARSAG